MSRQATTVTELARQVNRNPGTVCRWLKRPDWPFARRGPWDAAAMSRIKAWTREHLQENRASSEPWTQEEIDQCERIVEHGSGMSIAEIHLEIAAFVRDGADILTER